MENYKNKEIDNLVKEAEAMAKERLKGFVNENQIGYRGCLVKEMKEILNEKGIDWKPDYGEVSED